MRGDMETGSWPPPRNKWWNRKWRVAPGPCFIQKVEENAIEVEESSKAGIDCRTLSSPTRA
jgi:hypothetical protein